MKKDKTLKVFTKEDIEAFKEGYFRSLGKKSVEARRLKYGKEGMARAMRSIAKLPRNRKKKQAGLDSE